MSTQSIEKFRQLFAQEADVRLGRLTQLLLQLERDGGDTATIDDIFREVHTLKGSAAVVGFDALSRFAHGLEERLDALRHGSPLTPPVVDGLLSSVDALGKLVTGSIEGRSDPELAAIAAEMPTAAIATLERPDAGGRTNRSEPATSSRSTILVPVERLEELVRLVGEAASAGLRVERLIHERLGQQRGRVAELAELSRLLNDIQDKAMRTQMVPIATVTDQLNRAVRDLARGLGKDIRWEVEGEQTELDRSMLHQVSDALLHMVRNAVDHGIESPAERRQVGKPATGLVRLHAAQLGSEVIISVSDDGRGIDVSAVRAAATGRGVDVDGWTDGEVLQLIFRSGLSTVKFLTDVSGRGVGLDVVHNSVEAARGRVEVESEAGAGTVLSLVVPITLAVLPCLLVEAGGQRFAMPLHRIVVVQKDEIAEGHGEGRTFMWLEDEPVWITPLADVLGLPDAGVVAGSVVVVKGIRQRHAFRVDALVGHRDVVVKGLSGVLPLLDVVAGTSIEPDGSVLVVLDPPGLVERARHVPRLETSNTDVGPPEKPHHVLVVDDALTVRELQRSILERAGFEVSVAVDGVEALDRLSTGGIDLVLTDVQMPRMDGFALTAAIRQHPALANLPILIVTTLDSPEHRHQGMEAGADGYIVKASFDERSLIDAVRGALGGVP